MVALAQMQVRTLWRITRCTRSKQGAPLLYLTHRNKNLYCVTTGEGPGAIGLPFHLLHTPPELSYRHSVFQAGAGPPTFALGVAARGGIPR
jgi:hypothetical protein